jgi:RNA polymerase sigma-70 factor (ECF subfamily)
MMAEPWAEDGTRLSRAEIESAIRSLSAVEETAIMKIAFQYAKLTSYGAKDLVQETCVRALEGRRAWPRGLSATQFFWGVIRSVADEWRRRDVPVDRDIEDIAADEGHRWGNARLLPQTTAEERVILDRNYITEILKAHDDDPIAQKIIRGMADGAKGDELLKISGLSQTEYESKRRKIRRRAEKLGWKE